MPTSDTYNPMVQNSIQRASTCLVLYLATRAWASMWCTLIIGRPKLPATLLAFRTPTVQKVHIEKNRSKGKDDFNHIFKFQKMMNNKLQLKEENIINSYHEGKDLNQVQ